MSESIIHFHPGGPLLALVGNPNCGKTALFNLLTGSRQKVANYAGVTVERKEGKLTTPSGKTLRVLDLPGTYSLHPRSPDERVTHDVLYGRAIGEKRPDLVVCVVDATNLRRSLRLVLSVKRLGLPCVVAVNMQDLGRARGLHLDLDALSRELGLPVVGTVGIKGGGDAALRTLLDDAALWLRTSPLLPGAPGAAAPDTADLHSADGDHAVVQSLLKRLALDDLVPHTTSDRLDRVLLHPVAGPILLAMVLFLIFQAVFSWSVVPMDAIKNATLWLGNAVGGLLSAGGAWDWVKSLVVDGVIAGAGGVIVFLPQIIILFFFILVLEESGYLPRAAFLLDRIMGGVGLSGRSFIPLLSSFACAIPGIMATRSIANPRDRLVTIMIAPLMTCSARLPVYALLIAAFIPEQTVAGVFNLQGVVLFALYLFGIVSAMAVAWVMKRFARFGDQSAGRVVHSPLLMELPAYRWPNLRNLALGLYERAWIFLQRVGTIILTLTILLWFLSTFPSPPEGATGPAIQYSAAGIIGGWLEHIFAPIGFNWQISIALVPGLAAREVAVGALGTVYSMSAAGNSVADALSPVIAQSWSLATAYSLLAWYVFAPQCISTLVVVKRETNSWRYPLLMAAYLFALAYIAAFATYRLTLWIGG